VVLSPPPAPSDDPFDPENSRIEPDFAGPRVFAGPAVSIVSNSVSSI